MAKWFADFSMNARFATKRALRYVFYRAELETVALTRMGKLWPAATGRGLVFCFHRVCQGGSASNLTADLAVTPRFLVDTITAAIDAGLTPVPLEDLPKLLADPTDRRKFVCFSFDDGYRDNAELAAPVFRMFAVPYTIFITAGFVERTRSMWWETAQEVVARCSRIAFDFGDGPEAVATDSTTRKQIAFARLADYTHRTAEDEAVARIEDLARANGIDPFAIVDRLAMDSDDVARLADDPLVCFGAHSVTHVNLRRVDDDRLYNEVVGSADAVQRYVGRRPAAFAYPYGGADAAGSREMHVVGAAGFSIGLTTRPLALSADDHDNHMGHGRVYVKGEYQSTRHAKALATGVPLRIRW